MDENREDFNDFIADLSNAQDLSDEGEYEVDLLSDDLASFVPEPVPGPSSDFFFYTVVQSGGESPSRSEQCSDISGLQSALQSDLFNTSARQEQRSETGSVAGSVTVVRKGKGKGKHSQSSIPLLNESYAESVTGISVRSDDEAFEDLPDDEADVSVSVSVTASPAATLKTLNKLDSKSPSKEPSHDDTSQDGRPVESTTVPIVCSGVKKSLVAEKRVDKSDNEGVKMSRVVPAVSDKIKKNKDHRSRNRDSGSKHGGSDKQVSPSKQSPRKSAASPSVAIEKKSSETGASKVSKESRTNSSKASVGKEACPSVSPKKKRGRPPKHRPKQSSVAPIAAEKPKKGSSVKDATPKEKSPFKTPVAVSSVTIKTSPSTKSPSNPKTPQKSLRSPLVFSPITKQIKVTSPVTKQIKVTSPVSKTPAQSVPSAGKSKQNAQDTAKRAFAVSSADKRSKEVSDDTTHRKEHATMSPLNFYTPSSKSTESRPKSPADKSRERNLFDDFAAFAAAASVSSSSEGRRATAEVKPKRKRNAKMFEAVQGSPSSFSRDVSPPQSPKRRKQAHPKRNTALFSLAGGASTVRSVVTNFRQSPPEKHRNKAAEAGDDKVGGEPLSVNTTMPEGALRVIGLCSPIDTSRSSSSEEEKDAESAPGSSSSRAKKQDSPTDRQGKQSETPKRRGRPPKLKPRGRSPDVARARRRSTSPDPTYTPPRAQRDRITEAETISSASTVSRRGRPKRRSIQGLEEEDTRPAKVRSASCPPPRSRRKSESSPQPLRSILSRGKSPGNHHVRFNLYRNRSVIVSPRKSPEQSEDSSTESSPSSDLVSSMERHDIISDSSRRRDRSPSPERRPRDGASPRGRGRPRKRRDESVVDHVTEGRSIVESRDMSGSVSDDEVQARRPRGRPRKISRTPREETVTLHDTTYAKRSSSVDCHDKTSRSKDTTNRKTCSSVGVQDRDSRYTAAELIPVTLSPRISRRSLEEFKSSSGAIPSSSTSNKHSDKTVVTKRGIGRPRKSSSRDRSEHSHETKRAENTDTTAHIIIKKSRDERHRLKDRHHKSTEVSASSKTSGVLRRVIAMKSGLQLRGKKLHSGLKKNLAKLNKANRAHLKRALSKTDTTTATKTAEASDATSSTEPSIITPSSRSSSEFILPVTANKNMPVLKAVSPDCTRPSRPIHRGKPLELPSSESDISPPPLERVPPAAESAPLLASAGESPSKNSQQQAAVLSQTDWLVGVRLTRSGFKEIESQIPDQSEPATSSPMKPSEVLADSSPSASAIIELSIENSPLQPSPENKRGRGRPKKSTEDSSKMSAEKEMNQKSPRAVLVTDSREADSVSIPASGGASPVIEIKRGRGRPKKSLIAEPVQDLILQAPASHPQTIEKVVLDTAEVQLNTTPLITTEKVVPDNIPPIKRGRGRPRKSDVSPRGREKAEAGQAATISGANIPASEQTVPDLATPNLKFVVIEHEKPETPKPQKGRPRKDKNQPKTTVPNTAGAKRNESVDVLRKPENQTSSESSTAIDNSKLEPPGVSSESPDAEYEEAQIDRSVELHLRQNRRRSRSTEMSDLSLERLNTAPVENDSGNLQESVMAVEIQDTVGSKLVRRVRSTRKSSLVVLDTSVEETTAAQLEAPPSDKLEEQTTAVQPEAPPSDKSEEQTTTVQPEAPPSDKSEEQTTTVQPEAPPSDKSEEQTAAVQTKAPPSDKSKEQTSTEQTQAPSRDVTESLDNVTSHQEMCHGPIAKSDSRTSESVTGTEPREPADVHADSPPPKDVVAKPRTSQRGELSTSDNASPSDVTVVAKKRGRGRPRKSEVRKPDHVTDVQGNTAGVSQKQEQTTAESPVCPRVGSPVLPGRYRSLERRRKKMTEAANVVTVTPDATLMRVRALIHAEMDDSPAAKLKHADAVAGKPTFTHSVATTPTEPDVDGSKDRITSKPADPPTTEPCEDTSAAKPAASYPPAVKPTSTHVAPAKATAADSVLQQPAATTPVVKRGRGRPRKHSPRTVVPAKSGVATLVSQVTAKGQATAETTQPEPDKGKETSTGSVQAVITDAHDANTAAKDGIRAPQDDVSAFKDDVPTQKDIITTQKEDFATAADDVVVTADDVTAPSYMTSDEARNGETIITDPPADESPPQNRSPHFPEPELSPADSEKATERREAPHEKDQSLEDVDWETLIPEQAVVNVTNLEKKIEVSSKPHANEEESNQDERDITETPDVCSMTSLEKKSVSMSYEDYLKSLSVSEPKITDHALSSSTTSKRVRCKPSRFRTSPESASAQKNVCEREPEIVPSHRLETDTTDARESITGKKTASSAWEPSNIDKTKKWQVVLNRRSCDSYLKSLAVAEDTKDNTTKPSRDAPSSKLTCDTTSKPTTDTTENPAADTTDNRVADTTDTPACGTDTAETTSLTDSPNLSHGETECADTAELPESTDQFAQMLGLTKTSEDSDSSGRSHSQSKQADGKLTSPLLKNVQKTVVHVKECGGYTQYTCGACAPAKVFSRGRDMCRHLLTHCRTTPGGYKCFYCPRLYHGYKEFEQHVRDDHGWTPAVAMATQVIIQQEPTTSSKRESRDEEDSKAEPKRKKSKLEPDPETLKPVDDQTPSRPKRARKAKVVYDPSESVEDKTAPKTSKRERKSKTGGEEEQAPEPEKSQTGAETAVSSPDRKRARTEPRDVRHVSDTRQGEISPPITVVGEGAGGDESVPVGGATETGKIVKRQNPQCKAGEKTSQVLEDSGDVDLSEDEDVDVDVDVELEREPGEIDYTVVNETDDASAPEESAVTIAETEVSDSNLIPGEKEMYKVEVESISSEETERLDNVEKTPREMDNADKDAESSDFPTPIGQFRDDDNEISDVDVEDENNLNDVVSTTNEETAHVEEDVEANDVDAGSEKEADNGEEDDYASDDVDNEDNELISVSDSRSFSEGSYRESDDDEDDEDEDEDVDGNGDEIDVTGDEDADSGLENEPVNPPVNAEEKTQTLEDILRNLTCGFCLIQYTTKDELRDHYRVQHAVSKLENLSSFLSSKEVKHLLPKDKPFTCTECGCKFYKKADLEKHSAKHAKKEPSYDCEFCTMTFKTTKAYDKHVRTTHLKKGSEEYAEIMKPYLYDVKCNICDDKKVFKRVMQLRDHMMLAHSGGHSYGCDQCEATFLTPDQKKLHEIQHASRPFACSICHKLFVDARTLATHKATHNEKSVKCEECGEMLADRGYLREHAIKHALEKSARAVTCEECGKQFTNANNMRLHRRVVHTKERPFQCAECPAAFHGRRHLNRHLARHTGDKPHRCALCPAGFVEKHDLKRHVMSNHRTAEGKLVISLSNHATSNPDVITIQCPICLKKFLNRELLRKHSYVHGPHGLNTHVCDVCGKSFPSKFKLENHVRRFHTGDRPYRCVQCDKTFLTAAARKKHANRHSSDKKFKCNKCCYSAVENAELKRHQRVHDKEANGKFLACEKCNKKFYSLASFRDHLLTHEGIMGANKCKHCGQKFTRKDLLLVHLNRVHAENHEVVLPSPEPAPDDCICAVCQKGFARKSELVKHYARSHPGARPFKCSYCESRFRTEGSVRVHERIHTGTRPHVCPQCGKGFTQSGTMREHVQACHNKFGKYKCTECQKEYSSAKTLKLHARVHRPESNVECPVCSKHVVKGRLFEKHIARHQKAGELTFEKDGSYYIIQTTVLPQANTTTAGQLQHVPVSIPLPVTTDEVVQNTGHTTSGVVPATTDSVERQVVFAPPSSATLIETPEEFQQVLYTITDKNTKVVYTVNAQDVENQGYEIPTDAIAADTVPVSESLQLDTGDAAKPEQPSPHQQIITTNIHGITAEASEGDETTSINEDDVMSAHEDDAPLIDNVITTLPGVITNYLPGYVTATVTDDHAAAERYDVNTTSHGDVTVSDRIASITSFAGDVMTAVTSGIMTSATGDVITAITNNGASVVTHMPVIRDVTTSVPTTEVEEPARLVEGELLKSPSHDAEDVMSDGEDDHETGKAGGASVVEEQVSVTAVGYPCETAEADHANAQTDVTSGQGSKPSTPQPETSLPPIAIQKMSEREPSVPVAAHTSKTGEEAVAERQSAEGVGEEGDSVQSLISADNGGSMEVGAPSPAGSEVRDAHSVQGSGVTEARSIDGSEFTQDSEIAEAPSIGGSEMIESDAMDDDADDVEEPPQQTVNICDGVQVTFHDVTSMSSSVSFADSVSMTFTNTSPTPASESSPVPMETDDAAGSGRIQSALSEHPVISEEQGQERFSESSNDSSLDHRATEFEQHSPRNDASPAVTNAQEVTSSSKTVFQTSSSNQIPFVTALGSVGSSTAPQREHPIIDSVTTASQLLPPISEILPETSPAARNILADRVPTVIDSLPGSVQNVADSPPETLLIAEDDLQSSPLVMDTLPPATESTVSLAPEPDALPELPHMKSHIGPESLSIGPQNMPPVTDAVHESLSTTTDVLPGSFPSVSFAPQENLELASADSVSQIPLGVTTRDLSTIPDAGPSDAPPVPDAAPDGVPTVSDALMNFVSSLQGTQGLQYDPTGGGDIGNVLSVSSVNGQPQYVLTTNEVDPSTGEPICYILPTPGMAADDSGMVLLQMPDQQPDTEGQSDEN